MPHNFNVDKAVPLTVQFWAFFMPMLAPDNGCEHNIEMGVPGAAPWKHRLWMGVFHANGGFKIMVLS